MDELRVVGARQHNLKGLTLTLPRNRLIVFTGPSGSGKSSLAFDTIYAEGQRRYVESLSAYARQFLEQLPKPDVDSIEGLSPALAIEQRPLGKNPRSTVGTVTEIADYLRLVFARAGRPHCPRCGNRIEAQTPQQIVDRILGFDEGSRIVLRAPVCRAQKGELRSELARLRREGFVRIRLDGENLDLGDELVIDRAKAHDLDVIVDRISVKPAARPRLTDSVELAFKMGEGVLLVEHSTATGGPASEPILLSERFACVPCGLSLPAIEPRLFSFNGPHGACPTCDGLGVRVRIDPSRVVPDETLSLREGAVCAWGRRGSVRLAVETDRAVTALGIDPDVAFQELPVALREQLLHGRVEAKPPSKMQARSPSRTSTGAPEYEGVLARLERLMKTEENDLDPEDDGEEVGAETELGRFSISQRCDACEGQRLRPEALAVKLAGHDIAALGKLPLGRLRDTFVALREFGHPDVGPKERAIMAPLLGAIIERLRFLIDVGLDYLSLDRPRQSLSGGEGQRIRLATQLGTALVGVLYVLDEPSVGLHAKDNARLLEALRRLSDLGNTVIVVEHDRDAILAADWVVDMGPGAGVHGGQIVAEGTPQSVMANPASVTGPYLCGAKCLRLPGKRKARTKNAIRISAAREHNLKGIDVEFPTGLLVAITGVSGSGKSSLIVETLLPAARAALYRTNGRLGDCDGVSGLELIDKVIAIDQAPIGRTPRSNPATYTGIFAILRELYAGLPEARARGYKAGRFSFNVKGGRCESCQGDGVLRVQLHFLPDLFVTCEACGGKRYNRETLEVQYRGMSITEALQLTVDEARAQFEAIGKLRERLEALSRVGLGYVKLGQSATTLSGGEAQRVKLARELAKRATGRTLYVLDEPTTGLHFADIELLLVALTELRDTGNTVILIEHNIDVIACCDWVVDLGPGGGEHGGQLVAAGPPEAVADVAESATGLYLRAQLGIDAVTPPWPKKTRDSKTKKAVR